MGRIDFESRRLFCPDFADVFVGRETVQGFEPASEVVSIQEVGQMLSQLAMRFVVVTLDRGILDCSVHSFGLPVRPGMIELGEAVFDLVLLAPHGEHVRHVLSGCAIAIARREGELDAVVGQNRVDPIRNSLDQRFQERARRAPIRLLLKLGESQLGGSVDSDKEIQFALNTPDLGDINMKEPDRVPFEPFLGRFLAIDIRQPADPVALQAAVQ